MKKTALLLTLLVVLGLQPLVAQPAFVGTEFRINSQDLSRNHDPAAAYTQDGFFTVWTNQELGIVGRVFNRAGAAVGQEAVLVANDPVTVPFQGTVRVRKDPALVAYPRGDFLLFWTEEVVDLRVDIFIENRTLRDRDVFMQRFDPAGNPRSEAVPVNTTRSGYQSRPQAVRLPDGRLLVVWHSARTGDPAEDGVFGRIYSRSGRALTAPFRVDEAGGSARGVNPTAAADADGNVLVAWQACCGREIEPGIFARLLDAQGEFQGGVFRVSAPGPRGVGEPAVAPGPNGDFLVLWTRQMDDRFWEYRIFGRFVSAAGQLLGAEFRTGAGLGRAEASPQAVATRSGGFALAWVVWHLHFPSALVGMETDATAIPLGEAFTINQRPIGSIREFAMAAGPGEVLVAWEGFDQRDRLGIAGRRLRSEP